MFSQINGLLQAQAGLSRSFTLMLLPLALVLVFLRSLLSINSAAVASWSSSTLLGKIVGDVDAELEYPELALGPKAGDGSVAIEEAYEDEA